MKISLESTTHLITIEGVPARLWEGTSEEGTPVHAFIALIAVPEGAPAEQIAVFERELSEQRPPSVQGASWPLRMVL